MQLIRRGAGGFPRIGDTKCRGVGSPRHLTGYRRNVRMLGAEKFNGPRGNLLDDPGPGFLRVGNVFQRGRIGLRELRDVLRAIADRSCSGIVIAGGRGKFLDLRFGLFNLHRS